MNTSQKYSTPIFSTKKRVLTFIILPTLTLISVILALIIGSAEVSVVEAFLSLLSGNIDSAAYKIIFQIRLPRVLGAIIAGAALAVSGVIIQAVLHNPMASPSLIGVNAGAGFFAIIAMAVFPQMIISLPLFSFVGALLASLLIYAISAVAKSHKITVILVGVAVGSILTAGINTVKVLFPDSVYDVSGFLIGGLSSVTMRTVAPAAAVVIPALLLAILFSRRLDILSLGDEMASSLGMRVRLTRMLCLTTSSLLAGAAVSYVGLIGFIGLIVPHLMRRFVGNSHRYLIPASILGGGLCLLLGDLVSRVAFAPYELPVGILLSLIGGPFFILLILTKRRQQYD